MDSSLKEPSTRPSSSLSFGLLPIPPNVNRTETNLKIKERESIRFFMRERKKTLKYFILREHEAFLAKIAQETRSMNTGTLLNNLYYSGDSYLIQCFQPGENYTITEGRIHKQNAIIHNITLLEKLIHQTQDILETGRRTMQRFIASISHLEAERILVISKTKKDALTGSLKQSSINHEHTIFKEHKDLEITTIHCKVNVTEKCILPMWKYHFCVLSNKTTVYSSIFAPANPEGNLVLYGPFIFQHIPSDSIVKLQFYTLELDFDFFMRPVDSFVLPLAKLRGEFAVDLSRVRSNQGYVAPIKKDVSPNGIELFDNLRIIIGKSGKTIDRSLA